MSGVSALTNLDQRFRISKRGLKDLIEAIAGVDVDEGMNLKKRFERAYLFQRLLHVEVGLESQKEV